MKIENTLENKEKFFAHYWGQNVLSDISNLGNKEIYPVDISNMYGIDRSHLELKPLSQISDKDLEKCLSILGQQINLNDFRESFIEGLSNRDFYAQFYPVRAIEIGDYLRSKSYALPYMNLSVEDLINYSWIKLSK